MWLVSYVLAVLLQDNKFCNSLLNDCPHRGTQSADHTTPHPSEQPKADGSRRQAQLTSTVPPKKPPPRSLTHTTSATGMRDGGMRVGFGGSVPSSWRLGLVPQEAAGELGPGGHAGEQLRGVHRHAALLRVVPILARGGALPSRVHHVCVGVAVWPQLDLHVPRLCNVNCLTCANVNWGNVLTKNDTFQRQSKIKNVKI